VIRWCATDTEGQRALEGEVQKTLKEAEERVAMLEVTEC
jgi:hypothetical protein